MIAYNIILEKIMTPKTTSFNCSRLNCQIPNYKTKMLELSKERESSSIYTSSK